MDCLKCGATTTCVNCWDCGRELPAEVAPLGTLDALRRLTDAICNGSVEDEVIAAEAALALLENAEKRGE